MLLKFDLDDESYELDLTRILNTEAIAAQKVNGEDSWDAILRRADNGDATAITALVWIAVKRRKPDLRFSELEFPLHETWVTRELIDPDAEDEATDPPQPSEAEAGNG
jgi:hypothetical protein